MPVTFAFMRKLDEEYQRLSRKSTEAGPKNGTIPIGGGDWMDYFFRAEAIRGMLTALRHKKTYKEALADGKAVCEIAIEIWNGKREYQVRRATCWIEDFLTSTVKRITL